MSVCNSDTQAYFSFRFKYYKGVVVMKRYVKEFANDVINRLNENAKTAIMCANADDVIAVNDTFNKRIKKITNALKFCERGYVSDFETVALILNIERGDL